MTIEQRLKPFLRPGVVLTTNEQGGEVLCSRIEIHTLYDDTKLVLETEGGDELGGWLKVRET